jgi:hypothetical protein
VDQTTKQLHFFQHNAIRSEAMADATATYFQLSAVLDGTLFTITIKKENDLGHSRGVVLSRAVHSCDLLRLNSLNGRFVRLR